MFEDNYNAAIGTQPTTNMPTRIEGDYSGQFKVGVNTGSLGDINQNAEIFGDVNVAVDWTDGQSTNPFTGSASNILVRDVTSGASETLTGTLNVDTALGGTISRVTNPSTVVGGFTIPETNTGAFQFGMNGRLSGSEGEVDATVLVGGTFHGTNAETMTGVVSGGFSEVGSTNPAIFDAGIGGVIYLNRQ
ncbi:hypothetical protein [Roseicitreum antarcticum]|uniref:Transferrin-binding protein B C-lobe/N-lobe beta barrel domain-containing protein n=2 Tax=Roseicitreum antarcticum TaxID=564137 RepID=A0A1H2VEQ1_9RHOB|nr:hypothetical protein [Roseicitreum antarcticum]SDW66349.1 hypothetical protein SAMN04488238_10333 [Roseicitreum antarcticum]